MVTPLIPVHRVHLIPLYTRFTSISSKSSNSFIATLPILSNLCLGPRSLPTTETATERIRGSCYKIGSAETIKKSPGERITPVYRLIGEILGRNVVQKGGLKPAGICYWTLVINKRNLTFRDESPNGFWGIKNGRWKFTLYQSPPRYLGYIVLEGGGGVWGLRVRNPPPPFPSTQSLDPRILAMCSRWFGNLGFLR